MKSLLFSISLLIISMTSAQTESVLNLAKASPPYRPSQVEVWKEMVRDLSQHQEVKIFGYKAPSKDNPIAFEEWKLIQAIALKSAGFPYHAQYLLISLIGKSGGTSQSQEALTQLAQLANEFPMDSSALERMAYDFEGKISDPEVRSLLAYHRARVLLEKNEKDWAQQSLKEISPETAWGLEYKYDRAIQTLKSGDSTLAYSEFEQVSKNDKTRKPTALQSKLALARLIFERKDFSSALRIYQALDLPTREKSRVLLEEAWSYYYDRAYGKSLGAIQAARSRYFSPLQAPETNILEMLIARELCQYDRVLALGKADKAKYEPLLSAIESRKALVDIPALVQLTLQDGTLQKRANAIQGIRLERKKLREIKWADAELKGWILSEGSSHETQLQSEANRMIQERIEPVANLFLEQRDQVQFLLYQAASRRLQTQDTQTTVYAPPQREHVKTDTLFWPVGDEAWLDEIPNYEVLIKSQCRRPIDRPGSREPSK